MVNRKRSLVTGGAGFLGSHLCAALLQKGHEVICLDNFYNGSRLNVESLFANPKFELLRHDVINPIRLEVDEIYNLACPNAPLHYRQNPVATTKTNVLGALNMLELAHRLQIPIFQASAAEVYGNVQEQPLHEEAWGSVNCIGPQACYDEGKRGAEAVFFDYRRKYNLSVRVARIFNTYGPHMHPNDGRVLSRFIVQALNHQTIEVYGAQQMRSFCYVSDMVDGMIALMEAGEQACKGPLNLGHHGELTLAELAQMIVTATCSRSQVVIKAARPGDVIRRVPDISRARKLLEWQPRIGLEEGLTKTIAYFKRLLTQQPVQPP